MVESATPNKRNLSHEVAGRIAHDIIANGWEEGHLVGREHTLLQRYAVSRDTFREALRILEWQGLITTLRGRSGGLVVAKPSRDAIINVVRAHLDFTDIAFAEVMEVRRRLERLAVRLATIRLTEPAVPQLEVLLGDSLKPAASTAEEVFRHLRVIHEVGRVSGNPLPALFIAPLDFVAIDFIDLEKLSPDLLAHTRASRQKILRRLVGAIVDNEEELALEAVNAYIRLTEKITRLAASTMEGERATYPQWFDLGSGKSAHNLIYRIRRDIRVRGLVASDRLGSESELIGIYDVSRSTLREALRILEAVGVTESRKGFSGGVFIYRADPNNTVEAAARFLEQSNLSFEQVYEMRLALDTFAVELAAGRRSRAHVEALELALVAESKAASGEAFAAAAGELHNAICQAAGNRLLALYINVLIETTLFQIVQKRQLHKLMENRTKLVRSHARIIRAIAAEDALAAGRHMRDHRAQVGRLLRL